MRPMQEAGLHLSKGGDREKRERSGGSGPPTRRGSGGTRRLTTVALVTGDANL